PVYFIFFFSSRRRHTRSKRDWSSDVCSSDLIAIDPVAAAHKGAALRPAAGHADVLLFPDIQAGNLVYKTLVHTAECENGCILTRSEERRVGKECRAWWSAGDL